MTLRKRTKSPDAITVVVAVQHQHESGSGDEPRRCARVMAGSKPGNFSSPQERKSHHACFVARIVEFACLRLVDALRQVSYGRAAQQQHG